MTTRTFGPADIERLATKLDPLCTDLEADDVATLHAVFAWAGQAVAAQESSEVGGFAFDAYTTASSLGGSFAGGASHTGTMEIFNFSLGASNPVTIGSASG